MKKNYISPNIDVVKLETTKNLLLPTSDTTTVGANESLAPELPGFSDDELFQFIMIHQ